MAPSASPRPGISRPRRLLAAFAALLSLLVLPAVTAPAFAAPTEDRTAAAAGWLARQLVDGERFEQDFGDGMVYPDPGLTLDAVLAFVAARVAGGNADAAMSWLATEGTVLTDYVGDGTSFSDAGRLAKVAYAAQLTGLDPTSFGGTDLVARLRSQLTASGRFSDTPAEFDISNAFGQSFALLALARTDAGVPAPAVAFLAGSECPGGGFPLNYGEATCTPDTDATAMAVQALLVPGGDPAAAVRGADWLVATQQPDGSFAGTGTTATPNSNSTGLAAQALRATGRTGPADDAAGWLRTLQALCTAPVEQRGAIAYDGTGIDPGNVIRATAQAVLGLSGVGLAELSGAGIAAEAPELACAPGGTPTGTPTSSPTASPTSPATPTTTAPVPTATTVAPTTGAPRPTATVSPTTSPAGLLPVTPPPTIPASSGGALPNTGADVLPVLWLGAGLVLLGALTALGARRRPQRP